MGIMILVFLVAYTTPFDSPWFVRSIQEAFLLLGDYARQHVLLCLVPAMFIAGAITVFINRQSVIRYLGPTAPGIVAYSVAALSGAILAVCSCTVLPLFKGIYKKGAGLGPAVAFLYSGPAVNILVIVLSYKIFGWKMGVARMVGAVLFAVVIGMLMQIIFRKDEKNRSVDDRMFQYSNGDQEGISLNRMIVYIGSMIGILVFINWADSHGSSILWDAVFTLKYWITAAFAIVLLYALMRWFRKDEIFLWIKETRDFSLQIAPYLFFGVLVAGFFLGRPNHDALIPASWIASHLGGNAILSSLGASVSGVFMYFATLTEVPIVQSLRGAGMGDGPALALLLSGPSLSLPSILVINSELGIKKTATYVTLVILLSTLSGWIFGMIS